jgi:hypothetical protein
MAALRHAKWFEENASHSVVKALIRLLKHLRNKHEGLFPLNIWCIELLVYFFFLKLNLKSQLLVTLLCYEHSYANSSTISSSL